MRELTFREVDDARALGEMSIEMPELEGTMLCVESNEPDWTAGCWYSIYGIMFGSVIISSNNSDYAFMNWDDFEQAFGG